GRVCKLVETVKRALGMCGLRAADEVVPTEILVESSVLEHVVNSCEDGRGNGADGLLGSSPAAQAQELGLQIAAFLATGRPGTFDQCSLEPWCAFAQPRRAAFSSTFIIARTKAGPR